MFGRREAKHLGLSLLLGGAFACSSEANKSGTGIEFDPAGFDGFEKTQIPLLSTDCSYNDGNITLTLVGNETGYIFRRASDGVIVANANYGANECTVAVGKSITFTGGAGDQKAIIDFYSGIYTAALTSAQNITINLGDGTGDMVEVRTTTGNDLVTLGTNTTSTSYLTLSTVGATPVKITPDITITGAEMILVSTGAGNDSITAQGGAAVGHTAQNTVGAVDGAIALTLYGGDGNDTIVSGAVSSGGAHNALYGGAGNDFFPQQAALAIDYIFGGGEIDTVDYGSRSSAIRATLGTGTAAVAATGSISCVAKASLADNDYFVIPWDAVNSKRFAYKLTADAIQTGSITCLAKAGLTQNDYFSITDGTKTVIFEYDLTGAGAPAHGGTLIDISADATDIEVCARTFTALDAAHTADSIDITPTNPGGTATIALTADAASWGENEIDNTGTGLASFVQMAGGFAESAGNIAANATIIDISAVTSASAVCGLTYTAVSTAHHAVNFPVTATDPGGTTFLALVNDAGGVAGNQAITKTGNFTVSGMTGGAASIARDDGEIAGEGDDINAEIENVVGSSAGDIIDGSASDIVHVFLGMDGADTLTGGPGSVNYLYGGKGNDTLIGGGVADSLLGGNDDDTLRGGLGNDSINGGGVNCVGTTATTVAPILPFAIPACSTTAATASTAASSDTLDYSDRSTAVNALLTQINTANCVDPNFMGSIADTECDVIVGTGSPAVASVRNIRGGTGNDVLKGDARDNTIWGGAGNDALHGLLGNDALYGGAGNDTIYGLDGDNGAILTTQSDNDYLNGGAGVNTLKGDDGLDTIDASMGGDAVSCGLGDGDIVLTSGNETLVNSCEL